MSKFNLILSACFGKVTLDSFELADRAALRKRAGGNALRAYHCPHCKKWHVGNPHKEKEVEFRKRKHKSRSAGSADGD